MNTPSLRLEESNANLTANFYINRDIPDAAESGAWQDAIRLTLFDRLHCLGQRLTLLVDQARTLRAFDGRGFDLGFEQWATDVRWISGRLEHPFDIDIDDTEEGEPLPGIADVDEVMALLDRLKPAP